MEKVKYDDFAKLDLRVGLIKEVEDHPNADKLFVMKVDLGEGSDRTIVAGLKGFYSVEDLKGKKAVFIVNLEPVVLRGVESNGMILAAVSEGKKEVVLLKPTQEVQAGEKLEFKNG